jgi:hypothetical protein
MLAVQPDNWRNRSNHADMESCSQKKLLNEPRLEEARMRREACAGPGSPLSAAANSSLSRTHNLGEMVVTFFPCSLASLPNIRSHCYTTSSQNLSITACQTFIISRLETYCAFRPALNIEAHNYSYSWRIWRCLIRIFSQARAALKHSCITSEDLTSKRIQGCSYLSVYWNSRSTKTCSVTG